MANEISQLQNEQAEIDVLSACLSDENIYTSVKDMLSDDLFNTYYCQKMYSVIRELESEGKLPTITEASIRYTTKGGDITTFLSERFYSFNVIRQTIGLLQELSMKRRLYTLCVRGMKIVADPSSTGEDFNQLLSDFTLNTGDGDADIQSIGDAIKDLQTSVAKRQNGTAEKGLATGLSIFDMRYGFHPGDLVIVAGRTSQGKSTLATTIARNMAFDGIPSAYYSMEMGADQLTARIVARDTNIPSSRILYDSLSDGEYSEFYDTTTSLEGLPIYFDERSKTSFTKICTSIRAMVRKYHIKIAFIDYLQILVNSATSTNREQMLGDMARELKRLAVECQICIVALSQLSRNGQTNEPSLSELRGSGQIEEAADVVVLLYRPFVYGVLKYANGMETENTAQIEIAKGRNIGLAKDIVSFDGNLSFFSDYIRPMGQKQEEVKEVMPWQKKAEQGNLQF